VLGGDVNGFVFKHYLGRDCRNVHSSIFVASTTLLEAASNVLVVALPKKNVGGTVFKTSTPEGGGPDHVTE
jgi:hypothetical protein